MTQEVQLGRPKIWKASKDAVAGFMVTDNMAVMAGNASNFIAIDKTGIAISGKGISFNTVSENQRHGGVFVKMNDFVQMIPKTIVTIIPSQVPYAPVGMLTQVTKDLPFFLAMIGGAVAAGVIAKNI
jgi:hypothetical protein